MTQGSPFRYFKTSPEIIRLAVMMYVRLPLSVRNVEDLLHKRGIEISHENVRFGWLRFGPKFAVESRQRRVEAGRSSKWRWHLDEVSVKFNGQMHCLWRAVDHEGEVLASYCPHPSVPSPSALEPPTSNQTTSYCASAPSQQRKHMAQYAAHGSKTKGLPNAPSPSLPWAEVGNAPFRMAKILRPQAPLDSEAQATE